MQRKSVFTVVIQTFSKSIYWGSWRFWSSVRLRFFNQLFRGQDFNCLIFLFFHLKAHPKSFPTSPKHCPKSHAKLVKCPLGNKSGKIDFRPKWAFFAQLFYGFSKGTYRHIIDDKKVWPQSLREARRPYWNLPYIRGKFWAHALSAQWSCPAGNQLWMDEPYP